MPIAVGDKIPDVEAHVLGSDGRPEPVRTGEILGRGRVVLFAVPGAFTPTCSNQHLPGYVGAADQLSAKGVDKIVCVAVNDVWVLDAWADAQGAKGKIVMLSDGNAEFTRAMGLELDASGFGLGVRSRRYAAVVEDGVVTRLEVEPDTGVSVSACDRITATL